MTVHPAHALFSALKQIRRKHQADWLERKLEEGRQRTAKASEAVPEMRAAIREHRETNAPRSKIDLGEIDYDFDQGRGWKDDNGDRK